MDVHPSGYYAWKAKPDSPRVKSDRHLLGLIKQFWLESGGVYGYRKITDDLRDEGETCGKHRVYRLMRTEGLRSQTGYRRRHGNRHNGACRTAGAEYPGSSNAESAYQDVPGYSQERERWRDIHVRTA